MKFCRYIDPTTRAPRYGIIDGAEIYPLEAENIFAVELDRTPLTDTVNASDVMLMSPVSPSKIVCVGRNYREHA
ncbi:MAG: DUF2437 domain-containing protein, partial [Acidobacteriota bacterium]|nr:DUF2437 domain-containing protein [Acidobacteriota bacterium]